MVITLGAYLFAFGVLLFAINVWRSLRHGERAGPNPWDAPSLEWATSSPPPAYNFAVIPTVASRYPLWEDRLTGHEGRSSTGEGMLLDDGRETIGTSALDAVPDVILRMPGDSFAPLLLSLALAVAFAGHADPLLVAVRRRDRLQHGRCASPGSGPRPGWAKPWTSSVASR